MKTELINKILTAYNNHELGYIVTIEDYCKYLDYKGFIFALNANVIIGNYPGNPVGSYFEIKGIKLGETIKNQDYEVIKQMYNIIDKYKTVDIFGQKATMKQTVKNIKNYTPGKDLFPKNKKGEK